MIGLPGAEVAAGEAFSEGADILGGTVAGMGLDGEAPGGTELAGVVAGAGIVGVCVDEGLGTGAGGNGEKLLAVPGASLLLGDKGTAGLDIGVGKGDARTRAAEGLPELDIAGVVNVGLFVGFGTGVCTDVGDALDLGGDVSKGGITGGADGEDPSGVEVVADGDNVVLRVPMGKPGQKPQYSWQ